MNNLKLLFEMIVLASVGMFEAFIKIFNKDFIIELNWIDE